MITRIQPKLFLLTILVFAVLLSACAPIAPGGYSAPAASQERAASGDSAAPATEAAGEAAADSSYRPRNPGYTTAPAPVDRSGQYEAVTAGVTDDNEEWQDYLDYLSRNRHIDAHQRDVSERYLITVIDEAGQTVHDATVEIYVDDTAIFTGRTDAGGRLLFHPRALDSGWAAQQVNEYRVVATKGFVARSETFYRSRGDQWTVTIGEPQRQPYAQLDLLFLIDATGSMGDEIDKLKATMADIADQLARLPEQPDVRYGLVAYRDRSDAFVVRSFDFTPRLDEFQRTLAALRADGGGDEPEALNEALHRSIHELSWRNDNTVRLAILVADAPPHLDYRWEQYSYDSDMIEAVARGIKIFPVGASNLNEQGAYIFRQLAQFTGGKFVFLTYADGSNPNSGPGTETDHDVDNYSVDTLDRLVVRLVRDELSKIGSTQWGGGQSSEGTVGQQPVATSTPRPPRQPVSCTITGSWSDCEDNLATAQVVTLVNRNSVGQGLYEFNLDPRDGYDRVRFDITYDGVPTDLSVDIGDAGYTDGRSDNAGQPIDTAEIQVIGDELLLYGNHTMPDPLLYTQPWAVANGETLSVEIQNGRVAINGSGGIDVVESPDLFMLDTGSHDQRIYAAFNRSIDGELVGDGVGEVVVTLYPAR